MITVLSVPYSVLSFSLSLCCFLYFPIFSYTLRCLHPHPSVPSSTLSSLFDIPPQILMLTALSSWHACIADCLVHLLDVLRHGPGIKPSQVLPRPSITGLFPLPYYAYFQVVHSWNSRVSKPSLHVIFWICMIYHMPYMYMLHIYTHMHTYIYIYT